MRQLLFMFGLAAGACCVLPADGAISYRYVAGNDLYGVGPDGKVSITIYLEETTTSTSLITSEDGLAGAGFQVLTADGSGIRINSSTAAPALSFGEPEVHASGQSVRAALFVPGVTGAPVIGGLVALATVTFEATSQVAVQTFEIRPYLPGSTITMRSFYDLDVTTSDSIVSYIGTADAEPFQFMIAVPEPVSAMFLGVVGLLLIRRPAPGPRQ